MDIISPETGEFLEIDVWIPSLKLGFEYQVHQLSSTHGMLILLQDKHHYTSTWYANDTLDRYKHRDSVKTGNSRFYSYFII